MNQQKMYNNLAYLYDKIYSYKDYAGEVKFVTSLVSKLNHNDQIKVIDLACGTGKHLNEYIKFGYQVTGLDLNDGMLEIAKKNNPGADFIKGDLSDLKLDYSYDLISCLFNSIQYITSINKLTKSLVEIYKHLNNKGVFVFDLGYARDNWKEGYSLISSYRDNNTQIAMMAQSRSEDEISKWEPIIFSKINGVLDMNIDKHEIRLYSVKEMRKILIDIGFKVKIFKNFSTTIYSVGKSNGIPVFIATK